MPNYSETQKRVLSIHNSLSNDVEISDKQLIETIDQFFVMTNTLDAAKLLMWGIAPICSRREHLTDNLLTRVLRPLWMTAFRTENVVSWLNAHLQDNEAFGLSDQSAISWIKDLSNNHTLIDQMLIAIEEDENKAWTKDLLQAITPYSLIPVEKIKFRYYWSDQVLSRYERAIVFIYFNDETSNTSLRALTTILSSSEYLDKIHLFIIDEYWDFLDTYQDHPTLFNSEDDEPQVIWIQNQKIIAFLRRDKVNEIEIQSYTSLLIQKS